MFLKIKYTFNLSFIYKIKMLGKHFQSFKKKHYLISHIKIVLIKLSILDETSFVHCSFNQQLYICSWWFRCKRVSVIS